MLFNFVLNLLIQKNYIVHQQIFLLGLALILIGFLLIAISAIKQSKAEVAVVGFVGPFPFGISTSQRMLFFALIIALIILAGLLLLR